jgi:leucine dehydrogenase
MSIIFYEKTLTEYGAHFIIAIDEHPKHKQHLGGVRWLDDISIDAAKTMLLNLSQAMTKKSAALGSPVGGAKAVIIAHPHNTNPSASGLTRGSILKQFGQMVDSLNGQYITAVDIGMDTPEMDIIATQTTHVTCTTAQGGDVSRFTALVVFNAMQSTSTKPLSECSIVIQGAGKCGGHLASLLCEVGATVMVADTHPEKVQALAQRLPIQVIAPEKALSTFCDVFAPCAIGGVLGNAAVASLQCTLIAGTANCQLANESIAAKLEAQGVHYCPDYLINGGGLIGCVQQYFKYPASFISEQLAQHTLKLLTPIQ